MKTDLLSALRWLRRNPLFTVAVTAILALGIGANTAVFSVVDAVLLQPLPYESSARLVSLEETGKNPTTGISASDYLLWRDRRDLFATTAAYRKDVVTLTGAGEPDQVRALRVTAGLFPLLGVHPRLGQYLDDSSFAANRAVLSDRLWRRVFHADTAVLGRAITVSGEVFTIAGVMPPEFEFPYSYSDTEMWLPLRLAPTEAGVLGVVARTKQGLAISQAQAAMGVVARQMEQKDPRGKAGLRIAVSPWRETPERQYELTLVFILAAVGLVLLIACANVGSLLLSRAVQRQKEIAIRASLGASWWRLIRQLLAESFILAVLGSAAGIGAAYFALQFLTSRMSALPIPIPHLQSVALNEHVLLFNIFLCLALACICSLPPALLVSRTDPQKVLRGGHSGGGSKRVTGLFSVLIGAEVAFAFLLLVGSGLMIRSLLRLQQADHGFHAEHVLTMRVPVGTLTQPRPDGQYDTKPRQMAYYGELLDRIQRTPGVLAAAVVNNLPLSGANTSVLVADANHTQMLVTTRTISSQYFSVMGIRLLKGRVFSDADRADSPRVAILNEYLARQLFPDRDPIGQLLPAASPDRAPLTTVVGLVKDSSQMNYDQPAKGELYMPYRQLIFGVFLSTVVVRTSGEPLSLADALRKEIWSVNPNQPVVKVETMDDVIAESIWRPRFSAWIFSVLGGLALLLTSAGVYGVVAYTTALRVREVGIRVALGATPGRILRVTLRGAMIPMAAGLTVSMIAALFAGRLLTSLLFEIGSDDPFAYLGAAVLLLAVAAMASARPAWKASVRDPVQALRMK